MESNNNVSDYLSSSPTATLYAEDIEKLQKFIDDSQKKLNIMVMGQAGVGKSTLINAVVRKEVAQTGIGRPVTTEIAEYSGSGGISPRAAGIRVSAESILLQRLSANCSFIEFSDKFRRQSADFEEFARFAVGTFKLFTGFAVQQCFAQTGAV